VRSNLEAALADEIARGGQSVSRSGQKGSAGFVEKVKPMVLTRRETEVIEREEGRQRLQESPPPYGQKASPKSGANLEK